MSREFSKEVDDAIRDVRDVFSVFRKNENEDIAALKTIAVMVRLGRESVVLAAPELDPARRIRP